jgi:HK97 family phage portal protein
MGLLTSIFNFSVEDPSQPLLPMSALFDTMGLGRSDAGNLINDKQAMRMTTVFSCVKVISQDLSGVSFDLFQALPNDATRKAIEHRLYPLLHDRPNPNMSSMTWRGAMIAQMLLTGNAYSFIKRDKAARVIALVPLDAAKTSSMRLKDGTLKFATTQTENGQVAYLNTEDVLHFMPFSLDGLVGLSPIGMCKNAVGIGLAAEKFGAQFFASGARSTGVLSYPGVLDPEAYSNLKKSVDEWATGENALKPIILEEGLKWEQISVPPNDAQWIELRKFQKEEVAQLFRVPMHMLQDLMRSNNSNLEHQGREYVQFCLRPIAEVMEQEINFKLLGGSYSASHNFFDLQRGDFASLTTALISLRNSGIYSLNDVLRQLQENPVSADEGGDLRIVNGTFIPLDSLLLEDPKPAAPETHQTDSSQSTPAALRKSAILASYRPLFRDAVGRSINRNGDGEFIKKAFQPIVNSMLQTFLAANFGSSTLMQKDLDLIGKIVGVVVNDAATWDKTKASEIATRNTQQVFELLAQENNHYEA